MHTYDYKVVSAPSKSKKVRGVREPAQLFALTLTEAINEHARDGWEYVRAESLSATTPGGFFKRPVEESVTVLVFRRPRAKITSPAPEAATTLQHTVTPEVEPEMVQRSSGPIYPEASRAEPAPASASDRILAAGERRRMSARDGSPDQPISPLRPSPRLGPADRS